MHVASHELLHAMRRWWWLLLLGPVIGGVASFNISSRQSPEYQATTMLLISPRSATDAPDYNAILASQNLAITYRELVRIDPVLSAVIAELGLSESVNSLQRRVLTSTEDQSLIIQVSVADQDPEQAAEIANAIGRHAGEYVASTSMPNLVVADPAAVPSAPYAPRVPFSTLLGILVGLLVVGGGVVLFDLFHRGPNVAAA